MVSARVIPCLLLRNTGLVKTVKFKRPVYLGDPRNVVRIFNEKEVDELVILDILATSENRKPQFDLLEEIVSEAFMPVSYGGGINDLEDAKKILKLGVEKIVMNTYAIRCPRFIEETADVVGSQSVVVSLDVRRNLRGKYTLYSSSGQKKEKVDPFEFAIQVEKLGAGELLINSIDRDGTMSGYDIGLIRMISESVTIPVIACGGAGSIDHFVEALKYGQASAVAAGSFFVFQGNHRAVLISYPKFDTLQEISNYSNMLNKDY